jgi:glycosyltransferase involved in cell wall biosynthesis
MRFSIVTPSYNQCQFLCETIESIIGQEGDFYLDYQIIDGGSSDDSVEIIKRYEKLLVEGTWPVKCRGIKFRWSSGKDRGQTDALKKGFQLAEGDVLAWLNSDDVYLPGTLQNIGTFFQDNQDVALVYGDANYCDTVGMIIGRYPAEEFELGKLAYFNFICQPSTFFRKNAFEAVGGLDEKLKFGMDYDLFVKICKQFTCKYLPKILSAYRLHETSKTVCADNLFENHNEALSLALKHFGWAPLNRVYGSCNYLCLSRLPPPLAKVRILVILVSLLCTIPRSLLLNRGLRRADLKLLNLSNFWKLFQTHIDILKG